MRRDEKNSHFILFHLLSSLLILLIPLSAYASPKEDLEKTRKAMQEAKSHQAELASDTRKLAVELRHLQQELVDLAAAIQKGEKELSAQEDKLRILNAQVDEKTKALEKHKQDLAGLVQAALRLSRMPPEVIVMMPGDIKQTMQAARALKMTSQSIKQETGSIGLQLAELQNLTQEVTKSRDEAQKRQQDLDAQRQAMQARVTERQAAQDKLDAESRREASRLSRLAKKAQDLQDLITTMEKEQAEARKRQEAELKAAGLPAGEHGKLRSFAAARGHIRPPAAGRVVQTFGSRLPSGLASKGIAVATRDGAQVTAPYDGEVVYAGNFLAYGRLVILRHSDNFHTLLAGLAKISVNVGQFLLEGEPIGAMGEDASSGNRLYVELRRNNQPVDPAPWINGLNKKNQENQ